MIEREMSVELGSDHGSFAVGGVERASVADALPENSLVSWWSDPDPELAYATVQTGSQWGPFAVTVHALDSDPGPAEPSWEDVVELSVVVGDEVVISEIVDGPVGELAVVPGPRRMRFSARGRFESAARDQDLDEPDDAEQPPIEHFLVELWPAAPSAPTIVREESRYARELIDPPVSVVPPEETASNEAALRIIRDIRGEDGARSLPGVLSQVSVDLELPGTPVKVFNRVQHVFGWPPCTGGIGSPDELATGYHNATVPGSEGRYQAAGHVATTVVEREKPLRIVKRWNWLLPGEGSIDTHRYLLAEDSVVTVEIEKVSAKGEDPVVRVRLAHQGVPEVWRNDLERLWTWDLIRYATR